MINPETKFTDIVASPGYRDSHGKERMPTKLERSVQKLFEKNVKALKRTIDNDSLLDVESIDVFSEDSLFHVPVTRYTLPNGDIYLITISGAEVMGNVTNDYFQSDSSGELSRVHPIMKVVHDPNDALPDLAEQKSNEIVAARRSASSLAYTIGGLMARNV